MVRDRGKGEKSLHDHEEEDCVKRQQEDEHDGGLDGEEGLVIHVYCSERKERRSACVGMCL
jgi:hypothetical protein